MSVALLDQILAEIEDEDELDDFDPSQPSLESTAAAGHPFSVAWSHEVRAILAGLESRRLRDASGPWMLETPFSLEHVKLCAVIPDALGDGGLSSVGNFHDGFSTTISSSHEHLSASLGVTVGYPFLNASVSAKYDKTVKENKNGVKASRNASCRVGRVVVDETPPLSRESMRILQSQDGQAKFRKRYGDYYVCGFALGADAGACMSASTESMSSKETLEITVKVKLLFFTASATHTETWESSSQSSSMSFSGYSTLDPNQQPFALTLSSNQSVNPGRDEMILRQHAMVYLDKVSSLTTEVWKKLQELGLTEDGAELKLADCTRLCKSGLVVELLLAPYARLNH
ncbi:hypothetical protein QBC40DRAFT_320126 [Triangularia verruculosa]|uniref:Uncharacterized protein n=1 Tax=Triangularia verruculosa TaxID=2587418 RepID=A0AAN7B1Z4_9PEZI|nr:hypothetical protein QBC40DRAFT_320126 [Triangularia verruculosa]